MKCFVISPIGEDGSDIRAHADEVFHHIIEPALQTFNIEPIRSDQMKEPGKISDQMYRAIFDYDLCIAVLTFANPNVYYELAVAQAACRPVIILIEKGSGLPFDVKDFRSLSYDLRISTYIERVHINRLIGMLQELERAGWRGDDVFGAYRHAGMLSTHSDVRSYGVSITTPDGSTPVDLVDVSGTFQLIPPGQELRTLRYYPRQNGFIPYGAVAIDRTNRTWSVREFDIGGQSGEERGIDNALVGPCAKKLLDCWLEADAVHSEAQTALLRVTGSYGRWLSPIRTWPDDLVTCHRILVRRK